VERSGSKRFSVKVSPYAFSAVFDQLYRRYMLMLLQLYAEIISILIRIPTNQP
jgi:hypothetical protein